MKRAIVNFSRDCDYDSFKHYADFNKVSLSRALLELAQKSLNRWEDERVAAMAVSRKENTKADEYIDSNTFWDDLNV
ncbi:MAG: hypothetical protein IJ730_02705 [Alphaproteobacteria bacterium]|nr:hypothetical protein [Alphaproteobacteria bacterium]